VSAREGTEAPIAVLRRAAERGTPIAPVHAALGIRLLEVEPGRSESTMTAPADPAGDDPLLGPLVLADFALGVALNGTVAAGERIATLGLALHRVRPVAPGTVLRASAWVEDPSGPRERGVRSAAALRDEQGRTVARADARNVVLADDLAAVYGDTPAAYDEPWSAPDLMGARAVGDGVVARPHPATANSADAVQGGLLAAVAARALTVVLQRVPDEVVATFLRSTPADGSSLRARATVEHAGRRLSSGRATVTGARDRTLVTATGYVYADPG
jgi:acyl-coenzyme A thioesterase PaaI-like protein